MSTHKVNDIISEKIVFLGTFDECLEWKHKNGFGYRITKDEKRCIDCKTPLKDGFTHRCPECWDDIYFPK